MGCTKSREVVKIPTNGHGNVYNRQIKKQRKFRSGLHVEKTQGESLGAEANFQAAYTTDVDETYTPVLDKRKKFVTEEIPSVLELVNEGLQIEDLENLKKEVSK